MEQMNDLTKDIHRQLGDNLRYMNTRVDRLLYFFMAGSMGVVGKWVYDMAEKNRAEKN